MSEKIAFLVEKQPSFDRPVSEEEADRIARLIRNQADCLEEVVANFDRTCVASEKLLEHNEELSSALQTSTGQIEACVRENEILKEQSDNMYWEGFYMALSYVVAGVIGLMIGLYWV